MQFKVVSIIIFILINLGCQAVKEHPRDTKPGPITPPEEQIDLTGVEGIYFADPEFSNMGLSENDDAVIGASIAGALIGAAFLGAGARKQMKRLQEARKNEQTAHNVVSDAFNTRSKSSTIEEEGSFVGGMPIRTAPEVKRTSSSRTPPPTSSPSPKNRNFAQMLKNIQFTGLPQKAASLLREMLSALGGAIKAVASKATPGFAKNIKWGAPSDVAGWVDSKLAQKDVGTKVFIVQRRGGATLTSWRKLKQPITTIKKRYGPIQITTFKKISADL